jgi:hypothetical protein
MNKARVAEAARGFIPKLDVDLHFGGRRLIVDLCVSAEHTRVMIVIPFNLSGTSERR